MKPSTSILRTRFQDVLQRLSECIACAKDEGVYSEPYAEVVRLDSVFFCFDPLVLDLSLICFPNNKQDGEDRDWTPRDDMLLEQWEKFLFQDDNQQEKADIVAWRLDAIDRICELFWDQRKTQEALTQNQSEWVEATAAVFDTKQVAARNDTEQLAVEKEEANLIQKLDDLQAVEDLLRSLCEIAPGYPILLVERGKSARVAFFHRQLLWAKSQLDPRPTNKLAKLCGLSMPKLWEKTIRARPRKLASVTKSDSPPTSSTPKAVEFSQEHFLVDQDRDLLLDWEDLRRHHQSLDDRGRLKKWLVKPVISYRVAAWRARAHARCVELHHVITRCKRQLEDNTDARITAYHQSASPPTGGTANGSSDSHATALPTLREDRAKILLELNTARCLDSVYQTLCSQGPRGYYE